MRYGKTEVTSAPILLARGGGRVLMVCPALSISWWTSWPFQKHCCIVFWIHKILNGFWNIISFRNWLPPFHLLQCHHCWPTHTEACWIGSSPVFTLSVSCLLPSSYGHCLPAYLQLQKDIWRLKQELMKDELHRFHLWPPHKQSTGFPMDLLLCQHRQVQLHPVLCLGSSLWCHIPLVWFCHHWRTASHNSQSPGSGWWNVACPWGKAKVWSLLHTLQVAVVVPGKGLQLTRCPVCLHPEVIQLVNKFYPLENVQDPAVPWVSLPLLLQAAWLQRRHLDVSLF